MEPGTLCPMSTVLTIEKCAPRKKVSEWVHHFSPIVVNADIFGNTDITIFACPPKIWRRYEELSLNIARSFLVQIAEINSAIQFTVNNENDENTYGTALQRLSYRGKSRHHFAQSKDASRASF